MIRLISLSLALCLAALVFANDRGTVVGPEYCGDPNASADRRGRADTLYTRVSNGRGGTYRRTLEVGAAQCDPDRPAPRGTVVGPEYCGTGTHPGNLYTTLYTRVSNGRGGTYRRTLEENAPECPPILVTQVSDTGDRFVPVTFEVTAPAGYEYAATLGNVTTTDTGLEILGDGLTGTGQITIAGEEYQYTIAEEPRCERRDSYYDCLGYTYSGKSIGFIYYGDEDDRVVEWEISIVFWRSEYGDAELVEEGTVLYDRAVEKVEFLNKVYARSNVYIRYKLVAVGTGNWHGFGEPGSWGPQIGANWGVLNDVDIQLGVGSTCAGTCGCANPQTFFRENSVYPIGSASLCGGSVDAHEIGHSVGLAHGPDNRGFPAYGYIFRDFGHGHSTPFCGRWADIMSYESAPVVHMNSRMTCRDYADDPDLWRNVREEQYDNPAGSRQYADSAYHLNRVRYDVSLVNCERDNQCATASSYPDAAMQELEQAPLIKDDISKFPMGQATADFEKRWLEAQLKDL